jgi:hypothetical protein
VANVRDGVVADEQLHRVRRICGTLPGTSEKLSHGAPTFFVAKRVYAMFVDNHHGDGHVAVWIPVAPGAQASLIATWPAIYFRPPYVGVVELDRIGDEDLAAHLSEAWRMIGAKKTRAAGASGGAARALAD